MVRVADGSPPSSDRVVGELVADSPASVSAASELLNQSDVAIIQHEYGIYGGVDGDDVVDVIDGLRVPSIVIAHTVLKDPTAHQRSVLEAVAAAADRVVVMSEAASRRLCLNFDVDRRKIVTIPHGATVPKTAAAKHVRQTHPADLGPHRPGQGHREGDRRDGVDCAPSRPSALPRRRADASQGAGRTRRGVPQRMYRTGASRRPGRLRVLRRRLPRRRFPERSCSVRERCGAALRLHRSGDFRRAGRRHRQWPAGRRHGIPPRQGTSGQWGGHRRRSRRPRRSRIGASAGHHRSSGGRLHGRGGPPVGARRCRGEWWPVRIVRLAHRVLAERPALV